MSTSPSRSREERVNEVIAAYLEAEEAGPAPDCKQFLAQHADVAAEVEAFLADRHRFTQAAESALPPQRGLGATNRDRTARVWDAATGREVAVLRGHERAVHSAAFSADGRWVVTTSEDGTARIWEAATGKEQFTLRGHQDAVKSAVFSPDGQQVLTTSWDGTVRLWPVDPLPYALARKPRELTAEERARYELPERSP
jgi:WD40 repeat protein